MTDPTDRVSVKPRPIQWSLFWRDRNLKFHAYDFAAPTSDVEALLGEIDRDPTCIFWG